MWGGGGGLESWVGGGWGSREGAWSKLMHKLRYNTMD